MRKKHIHTRTVLRNGKTSGICERGHSFVSEGSEERREAEREEGDRMKVKKYLGGEGGDAGEDAGGCGKFRTHGIFC